MMNYYCSMLFINPILFHLNPALVCFKLYSLIVFLPLLNSVWLYNTKLCSLTVASNGKMSPRVKFTHIIF